MFYCPHANMFNGWRHRVEPANSYIRILNASPNAPSIDIYVNNKLSAQNLAYKGFSQYIPISPGSNNIKVYPAGQITNPVLDTDVYIPPNNIFNVAVIGTFPDISLYGIPEPNAPQNSGRACIRFVQLSPNAPAVDITTENGTKIFSNVKYKDYTVYACVPAGTYTFQVRPSGSSEVALIIPNVQLEANNYYAIYAVGQAGGSPPFEVMVVSEPK